MSQSELVIRLFRTLDALGIPAMLVGSHASSLHGEARSTHDIDVVVDLSTADAPGLIAAFPAPEFYVSPDAVVAEAIRERRTFNMIQVTTGEKVDFFLVAGDPFDRSRFARRRRERIEGHAIPVSTPEDTILKKLSWAVESGGSEKQFRDALAIYEVQHPTLDFAYLERWVTELGLGALWLRLRSEAIVTDGPSG